MRDLTIFNPIPHYSDPAFPVIVRFCEENQTALLASLPGIAPELAYAFGFDGMLVLVRAHGGDKQTCMKGGVGNGDLAKTVEAWSNLVSPYAITCKVSFTELDRVLMLGWECAWPSASGVMDIIKKNAALKSVENGAPISTAAREVGVYSRSLRRWVVEYGLKKRRGGRHE